VIGECWKHDVERCTAAGVRIRRQLSSVGLNYSMADRQPHARAIRLCCIECLKIGSFIEGNPMPLSLTVTSKCPWAPARELVLAAASLASFRSG
jgi:hypothetical protein